MKSHVLSIVALCTLTAAVAAQEAAAPVEAVRDTIRRVLEREGTFVPAGGAELALDPDQYRGELQMTEVRAHGTFVNEGDVLARFDTRKIDRQVADAERALERARMARAHAERNAQLQEAERAESLARAERAVHRAEVRLAGYREHEKPMDEEGKRLSVQQREHRLDDQRDELEQLEKMYSEDELVDATEEIVLKRSRRGLAQAEANFELSQRRREYQEEFFDSWREEDLVAQLEKERREFEKTRAGVEMAAQRTASALEKQRHELEQQAADLVELRADRKAMVVRAPRAGLLLHGEADGAPWTNEWERGSKVRAGQVFLAVSDPRALAVATSVEEKDFTRVREDMAVLVSPVAFPDKQVVGRLQVDYLPGKDGLFDARVVLDEAPVAVRPGMTAKARVVLDEAVDVVVVPRTAVRRVGDAHVVMAAATADGPFEERRVVVGLNDGTRVEIRDGLAAGEFVSR